MPMVRTEGPSMAKRRRRMEKRRRLYLLLDDWPWGYGIREIDLPSGDDPGRQLIIDGGGAAPEGPTYSSSHRLPSAIFRFEAERGQPSHFAGAFGSKILALQPIVSGTDRKPMDGVPVFDVRTRSFMFGPQRWPEPPAIPIYVPVGGRLFALAGSSFERLYPPLRDEASWEDFMWEWHKLPELLFRSEHVAGYAVHPDGRTIFVSVVGGAAAAAPAASLSFDTAEDVFRDGDCEWKQRGQWQLPFAGRAYYDPGLDAWVGLSGDPGTIGHLCSCDVVPTDDVNDSDDAGQQQQRPAMKLSKEKLFSEVPAERHMGATLVYMGDVGKFRLLECIYVEADELTTGSDDETNEDSVDEVIEKKDHRKRFNVKGSKKAVERGAGCRGGRGKRACQSGGPSSGSGTSTSSWTSGRGDTASARLICCPTTGARS
nr:uncharacterized protein LOC117835066 [Setaria viridis]